jgi:hypothetical protein
MSNKSEKSFDNHENQIQQEAMIVFCEKLKMPFRINPIPSVHMMVWFGLSAFLTIRIDTRINFEILARSKTRFLDPKFSQDSRKTRDVEERSSLVAILIS